MFVVPYSYPLLYSGSDRGADAAKQHGGVVYYEWLQLEKTLPVRGFHLDLLAVLAKDMGAFFDLASAKKQSI